MKKIQYIAPEMQVTTLNVADGILLSASDGESMLGNGGDTQSNNITSSDVKRSDYNVWNDDWSK